MNDAPLTDRERADALLRMGRFPEAIELLRNLAATFPEEESHLLALAWALQDSGNRREAASCFELLFQRELARNLVGGFAYDELVRIHREGNNREGLVSVCERAAAAQPEDAGLLKTLGDAYLMADRPTDALRVFDQLTAREPDAPENWCALGNARLAAGVLGEAEAAYTKAAELTPADAPVFFSRLAAAFLRAGHLERSQAAGERCVALAPDEPLYLMDLGNTLLRRGDADAATGAYARAASLNPASAGAVWYRLGTLLAAEGLHASAVEAFTNAVAAEPGNSRYLLALAASYAARGLTDLAVATLRRVESPGGVTVSDPLPPRPITG
ncbi:MAG: tetratricopeptide repeat protein [Syntrophales bacterium]